MGSKSAVVKEELADQKETTENGSTSALSTDQNESEYINIKMEIEVLPNISIKSEPADPQEAPEPRSPSPSGAKTWHVPVVNDTKLLTESISVTIKQEPDDEDLNAESDERASDGVIPATSTSSVNIEYSQETSSGRKYLCKICNKSFANPGNVQRHLQLHNRQTYKCTQCDVEFSNKVRLDKHIYNKHTKPRDKIYPCDVCQKEFKSSSNLMQHKKVHLTEKPFECPLCHKSFSFKTNLNKHVGKSRCKVPSIDPLICHVCQKVFQKEYLLKSHLRRHDTDRPFACDLCTTTFKHKSTLIRHMQLHNGIKPFSCPVCNKTFTTSGLLKPHMRVHTGERPYQCKICSKNFTHKHNMQRHMLRHDKIKHLVCDICHKEFPRESRLKYHMKTHVNEKYFCCHVCPKRFSHKQNILRHYTRKHPGQTYTGTDTDASVALKVWDTIKSKYYDDEAEVILGSA